MATPYVAILALIGNKSLANGTRNIWTNRSALLAMTICFELPAKTPHCGTDRLKELEIENNRRLRAFSDHRLPTPSLNVAFFQRS